MSEKGGETTGQTTDEKTNGAGAPPVLTSLRHARDYGSIRRGRERPSALPVDAFAGADVCCRSNFPFGMDAGARTLPGRVLEAQERLQKAVARLEAAARENAGKGTGEIAAELREVRSRCDTLEQNVRAVSGRLDAAIHRVKSILGD